MIITNNNNMKYLKINIHDNISFVMKTFKMKSRTKILTGLCAFVTVKYYVWYKIIKAKYLSKQELPYF